MALREERLAIQLHDDLPAETPIELVDLFEDRFDVGDAVAEMLTRLRADLDAQDGTARIGRVVGATGDRARMEDRPTVHRVRVRREHVDVEPVQALDHFSHVHDRIDAIIGRRPMGGLAVHDHVDPSESLVLHDRAGQPVGLDDHHRVDRSRRQQRLRADRHPFFVGDERHEQVTAERCPGLDQLAKREQPRHTTGLVVGGAEPDHPVALDHRLERAIAPVREPDRVEVRVHAQRRSRSRSREAHERIHAPRGDLGHLDLDGQVCRPRRDEGGGGAFAGSVRDQPGCDGFDPHEVGEQLLGCFVPDHAGAPS